MLELLLQGLAEWIHGLAMESWEYFSDKMLEIMSLDFEYIKTNIPVIETLIQLIVAVGWALLIGNLVFQAIKSMISGLGFEGDDPKLLFVRTFVFGFLLLASPQICAMGLDLTSRCMDYLNVDAAVDIQFVNETAFGTLGCSWLLVIIFDLVIMFKVFKLLMEIAERYVVLAVLTMCAPLAFATGGSKNTADIFTGWCRMFGSMCLLMLTNVIFFKMLLSLLSMPPLSSDVILWMIMVLAIVKVAHKADAIITRIGLNPAPTGGNMGHSLPGMLAYTVMRTAVSNVTKSVGKGPSHQGGQGGSACGTQSSQFHAEAPGQAGAGGDQGSRAKRTRSRSSAAYQNNQGTQQNTAYSGTAETSAQQDQRSNNTVIVGNTANKKTPSSDGFHGEVRSHSGSWQPDPRPCLAGIHRSGTNEYKKGAERNVAGMAERQADVPANAAGLVQGDIRSAPIQSQVTDTTYGGKQVNTGTDRLMYGSRFHGTTNAGQGIAGKGTPTGAEYASMHGKQLSHNVQQSTRSSVTEMPGDQSQHVSSTIHSTSSSVASNHPTGAVTSGGKTETFPNVIPMGPANVRSGVAASHDIRREGCQGSAIPSGAEAVTQFGRAEGMSVLNGTRSTKMSPEPMGTDETEHQNRLQPDNAGMGMPTSGQQFRESAAQERSTHVPSAQVNTPLKSAIASSGAGGDMTTRQSYATNQKETVPQGKPGTVSTGRQTSIMRNQGQYGLAGMAPVSSTTALEGGQCSSTRQERNHSAEKISGRNAEMPAHVVRSDFTPKAQTIGRANEKEAKETERVTKRKVDSKEKTKQGGKWI